MFTKNWYYGLRSTMSAADKPLTSELTGLKNLAGTLPGNISSISSWAEGIGSSSSVASNPSIYFLQTVTTSNGGAIIGTGTTPATIDDYKLAGDMITTFTYSKSVTITHDDDKTTITALYTITNTGAAAFTIGEIGLIAACYSSSNTSAYRCLVERTVLDSPVTIEAGGVGQVTYTIEINMPVAT